ncbi:MAG TPA: hypothetical protein VGG11_03905 [Xanthobacteraceae bacterium]|jgi:hypothetical protein
MRYLLGSAAAVLIASLTMAMPAWAGENNPVKGKSGTITLDGQCDVISFTYDQKLKLFGVLHTGCDRLSKPIGGIGIVIKHQPPGSSAAFTEDVDNGNGTTTGNFYVIGYPFITGSPWYMYQTQDGVNVGLAAQGTYTVTQ